MAEIEAKTKLEKGFWAEARGRSSTMLNYARMTHEFLFGDGFDPTLIETLFKEVDAIRYAMACAIAIRIARAEESKSAHTKKARKEKKNG